VTIKVNGDASELPAETTIAGLLERFGLSPGKVAIELNRRLLRGDRYDTVLREGDEIEIVTFVGGG
jgi:sulfur carrier protein